MTRLRSLAQRLGGVPPLRALAAFLRGFLGLAGAGGAPHPGGAACDAASARSALEERAARRRSCC